MIHFLSRIAASVLALFTIVLSMMLAIPALIFAIVVTKLSQSRLKETSQGITLEGNYHEVKASKD